MSELIGEMKRVLSQLIGLKDKTDTHDDSILLLQTRVDELETARDRLVSVTDYQGLNAEKLNKEIEALRREVNAKAADVAGLKSSLHGQKIIAGKAKAKLDKIQSETSRHRNR